jgi:thioredoxin
MIGRYAERIRDVLAGLLVEHPQRHNGTLDGAELLDARPKPDVLFGACDRLVGAGPARVGQLHAVDVLVRPRDEMPAPAVSRDVARDRHQHRATVVTIEGERFALRQLEERTERLLHTVDRVLGRHPLRPGDRGEGPALRPRQARERFEDVLHGIHMDQGVVGALHDENSTSVIHRALETSSRMEVTAMSHAKIPMVDEDSFPGEVLATEVPVLVEFGAKWCGPCRALEPILAALGEEGAGRWKIATVDIDESPTLARTYGVRGAPTVIVFARGAEAGRHLGMTRRETLVALVERAAR